MGALLRIMTTPATTKTPNIGCWVAGGTNRSTSTHKTFGIRSTYRILNHLIHWRGRLERELRCRGGNFTRTRWLLIPPDPKKQVKTRSIWMMDDGLAGLDCIQEMFHPTRHPIHHQLSHPLAYPLFAISLVFTFAL